MEKKFTAVLQGFGVRSRCITCRWRGLTARRRLPDRCLLGSPAALQVGKGRNVAPNRPQTGKDLGKGRHNHVFSL